MSGHRNCCTFYLQADGETEQTPGPRVPAAANHLHVSLSPDPSAEVLRAQEEWEAVESIQSGTDNCSDAPLVSLTVGVH